MRLKHLFLPVFLGLTLGGCEKTQELLDPIWGKEKQVIPGQRERLKSPLDREQDVLPARESVILGHPVLNAAWPELGGSATHVMPHLAFGGGFKPVFSVSAGESGGDVPPVVGDGRIYVLDGASVLYAFAQKDGRKLLERRLSQGETSIRAGGGITLKGGKIYVATPSGDLVCLEAGSGKEIWHKREALPFRSSPLVVGGKVFALTLNSEVMAFSEKTGEVLWKTETSRGDAGVLSSFGLAASSNTLVVPTTGGELWGLDLDSGLVNWRVSLAEGGRGLGRNTLAAIAHYPVIEDGVVYAASQGGQVGAFALKTGKELWRRDFSGAGAPFVHGAYLFVVGQDQKMSAFSKKTGRAKWEITLPQDQKWSGPVLAGGNLVLLSTKGQVGSFSPETGVLVKKYDLGGGFLLAPIVAQSTLYALSNEGTLLGVR